MIIDGRSIAVAVQDELRALIEKSGARPTLAIFTALDRLPENKRLAIEKFVGKKKVCAEATGIGVVEYTLPETTEEAEELISTCKADGIVVQLPLPESLDTERLCNAISLEKDVDLLSEAARQEFMKGNAPVLPPVVGAIAEIIKRHAVPIKNKKAVVIGKGALVGRPAAAWLEHEGAKVTVLDRGADQKAQTKDADIIVLGAGSPGLLTPDMVRDGVAVFDAGTSEAAGVLKGDADPKVAERAALFTPGPGGVGPITVAVLFKNLLTLNGLHRG